MSALRLRAATVIVPSLLLIGCGTDAPAEEIPSEVRAQSTAFNSIFRLERRLTLEQPDSAPIVRISGIDRDVDGRFVVGDVSEGNVKLFAADGRLLRVIGRKGRGPGEFSAPRYPRFGPNGRIYVADAQDPRVQVFESDGTLVSATRIAEAGVVMGFEPVTPDRYLLLVQRGTNDHVLIEVDRAGRELRTFLDIGKVRPAGERDYHLWRNVRSFFLAVSGDTAWVSSTISDSLWAVHLPTGSESRSRLVFEGYEPPSLPQTDPSGIEALMRWNRSFHAGSTLSSHGGTLYLPYVQGVLNEGDPMLLVARTDGRWQVMEEAPPIIGAGGGSAIGLLSPGEEQVELGLYTPAAP